MRLIVLVTFGLAAAYAGFWAFGLQDRKADIAALNTALTERGYDISWAEIGTRGFPSRFDTRVSALRIARGSAEITIPDLEIAAVSYVPDRLIATTGNTIMLRVGARDIPLTFDRLRAEIQRSNNGPATQVISEAEGIVAPGVADVARSLLALRARGDGDFDLYIEIFDARLNVGLAVLPVRSARIDARLIPVAGGYDARITTAVLDIGDATLDITGSTVDGLRVAGATPEVSMMLALLGLGSGGRSLSPGPIPVDLWWMDGG